MDALYPAEKKKHGSHSSVPLANVCSDLFQYFQRPSIVVKQFSMKQLAIDHIFPASVSFHASQSFFDPQRGAAGDFSLSLYSVSRRHIKFSSMVPLYISHIKFSHTLSYNSLTKFSYTFLLYNSPTKPPIQTSHTNLAKVFQSHRL